jgi:hypothetical protein
MSELLDEFGPAGYGVWWIILEKIAAQMDKTDRCSARYSLKKWSKTCGISVKKFQKVVGFLSKLGKLSTKNCEKNSDFLIIECPNLLKFRDEYSKKSRQTPVKRRIKSPPCPEQDTEADTEAEAEAEAEADDSGVETDPPPERIQSPSGFISEGADAVDPEVQKAMEDCQKIIGLSDQQITQFWGTHHDHERFIETVQTTVERTREVGVLNNPSSFMHKLYEEGAVSKRTREGLGGKEEEGLNECLLEILKEAVAQPNQKAMSEVLKKKDEKLFRVAEAVAPFLFRNKDTDFRIILGEYRERER